MWFCFFVIISLAEVDDEDEYSIGCEENKDDDDVLSTTIVYCDTI